jgi:formate dehydrogenase major subunit
VGCSALVFSEKGRVVNVEGDPDHPINEGTLCAKGAALSQIVNNDRRLDRVLYRAPGSTEWQEKSWEWAIRTIAARIKATRDATFVTQDGRGRTVNRTEGIACLGGAALDNEECYAYSKLARALGVVYLEHQARI